jgi:hypothetical protein
LVELLAADNIALCVQAAVLAEVVVVVVATAVVVEVVVAAVVGVVIGAAVDVVVVVLADWLLGLLEQPASTAAPNSTAITPQVALVIRSSVPEPLSSSVFRPRSREASRASQLRRPMRREAASSSSVEGVNSHDGSRRSTLASSRIPLVGSGRRRDTARRRTIPHGGNRPAEFLDTSNKFHEPGEREDFGFSDESRQAAEPPVGRRCDVDKDLHAHNVRLWDPVDPRESP